MKIQAAWEDPVPLKKCKPGGLIYELDIEQLPKGPAVYVFGRKHGTRVIPFYIGETLNLRGRIKGHLNSLPLMTALRNAPNGPRFLMHCSVKANAKAMAKKHIEVIEKSLILHAQSEGHVLFNKRGLKLPTHEIAFTGNRTSEAVAPRLMLVKRALVKPKRARD